MVGAAPVLEASHNEHNAGKDQRGSAPARHGDSAPHGEVVTFSIGEVEFWDDEPSLSTGGPGTSDSVNGQFPVPVVANINTHPS